MDVRASVPTDQIDKETAKPLTGDKFDRTKFDTLAADGFVSKEAALGVAPEILATVWAAAAAPAKKEMKAMKSTASVTHLSNMKASDEPL